MKPYTYLKSILAEFFPLHRSSPPMTRTKRWRLSARICRTHQITLSRPVRTGSDFLSGRGKCLSVTLSMRRIWKRRMANGSWISKTIHFTLFPILCRLIKHFRLKNSNRICISMKNVHTPVPWVFKYYERDWGFCLPKNTFDKLSHDQEISCGYPIRIHHRSKAGIKVATAVVHPEGGPNSEAGEFLVQAHTCHPMQANDDGAGVVSTIESGAAAHGNPLPWRR